MKKILTMSAVAAMVFTACSKDEGGADAGSSPVRITPTIANPSLTPKGVAAKGVTRATDTDFELNDKVGLTITMTADGKDFVSNKPMTFDGTDFKTEGFLWYEDINATSSSSPIILGRRAGIFPRNSRSRPIRAATTTRLRT
mgnify:CR=1 FL=1